MQLLNWRKQVPARKAIRPEASQRPGKKGVLRLEVLEDRTVPALSLFNTFDLYGDYVAAGVGLRNTGSGNINLGGIPGGSSIQAAYLYWGYLANADLGGAATFAGNPINGTLVGSGLDTCWGMAGSFTYRANVTALVSGNGSYGVNVTPGGPILQQGASLVVVYGNAAAAYRRVQVYQGNDALQVSGQTSTTMLSGFTATAAPIAKTTFIVGDGQAGPSDNVQFTGSLGSTNFPDILDGTDGLYWDTETHLVSANVGGGSTSASTIITAGSDCLQVSAQVFSVTVQPPPDFDDAAATFGTASHEVLGVQLGLLRDGDTGTFNTASANGDDLNLLDDEDGLTALSTMVPGGRARLTVNVQNGPGFLDAWIDFNGNGVFDASERITAGAGTAVVNGNNFIDFDVPVSALVGNQILRLRVSSTGGLAPSGATVPDGEVEDHQVNVAACPMTVYVDDSWAALAPGTNVDGDTFAAGFQSAFIGSTAFATIQQAITVVCPNGLVLVNPGTYPESVLIDKTLTLDGTNPDKTQAVIDPAAGNGITVTANGVVIRDLRVTGAVDGIAATGVASLTLNNVQADTNTDDGIDVDALTGTTSLVSVMAMTNTGHGLEATTLSALSVNGGAYESNTVNGINVVGVTGSTTLTNVTVRLNGGASFNGVFANNVNGMTVSGGTYSNNGFAGIGIQTSTNTVSLSNVTAQQNRSNGFGMTTGTALSVTNGNYSSNGAAGIGVATLSGNLSITNASVLSNGVGFNGVFANSVANVTVSGGNYNQNGLEGLGFVTVTGNVTVTNATATANGRNGLGVTSANNVTISGGNFSNNVANGIGLALVNNNATFTNVQANGNDDNGAVIIDARNVVMNGGSYSNNECVGIDIFDPTPFLNATGSINGATITNNSIGILVDGDLNSVVMATNNNVNNNTKTVCASAGNTGIGMAVEGGCLIATTNNILNNTIGAQLSEADGFLQLQCNVIQGNTLFGANNVPGVPLVDALFNYWGSPSGPTHATNPAGTGDVVSDNVEFAPWALNAACTAFPPPTLLEDGRLIVVGTNGRDTISFVEAQGTSEVRVNGRVYFFPTADITNRVVIHALGNADYVQIMGTIESEIHAGDGNDVVQGGAARDVIFGGAGTDQLNGNNGHDVVWGGAGRDRVSGGQGHDLLFGGTPRKGLRYNDFEAYTFEILRMISENWVNGIADTDLDTGWADDMIDTEQDRLTGGDGRDWFLGNIPSDILTDFLLGTDKRTIA